MSRQDSSTVLFLAVLAVLMIPFRLAWWGYVLHVLWAWFVVPLGVIEIGVAHGIGLSCVVALFVREKDSNSEGDPVARIIEALLAAFLIPAWLMLVGSIMKGFM